MPTEDVQSRYDPNWSSHREEIQQLYNVEAKSLYENLDIIQQKHGFKEEEDLNAVLSLPGPEDYVAKVKLDGSALAPENRNSSVLPSQSIREQSSWGERTAGHHNIQSNTKSTVRVLTTTCPFKPKLTTAKVHADSAASEYEASEVSADSTSIFSGPESISSRSSFHDLLGPIEEFAAMLIDDAELNIQYQSLRQTLEFSDFKSEFHRLLKAFSKDLSKEASIPIEKACVRFISQQRRRISYAFSQEVFELKGKSLFNEYIQQKQLEAKEKIERYLRDEAQSKGTDEDQNLTVQEENLENDSSEEEGELENFPSLKHIKKFLIESTAFEKLRMSIRQLVEHRAKTRLSRFGTAYKHSVEQQESLTVMDLGEVEELSQVRLAKGEHGSETFNEDLGTDETLDSSDFTPSQERSIENFGSGGTIEDEPEDYTYLTSIWRMIYWRVSRHLRPTAKPGYRRLEWQCVSSPLL
jgi:hypothetical protein